MKDKKNIIFENAISSTEKIKNNEKFKNYCKNLLPLCEKNKALLFRLKDR